MDNHALIPLLDPNLLEELTTTLREQAHKAAAETNSDNTKYQAIVFQKSHIHRKAHCNPLTAVARKLSPQEVCCCITIRDGKALVSTNRETRDGKFRKAVGELISQLIQADFSDEAKLALYRKCFRDTIRAQTKRYNTELSHIESVREYVITRTNWKDISLEEIQELKKDLETALDESISTQNEILATACVQVLLHLNDLDEICNELAEPCYEKYRIAMQEGSFANRFESPEGLHAELAAILRDSQKVDLKELMLEVNEKIPSHEFTLSKFCCYICYIVFKHLIGCLLKTQNEAFNQKSQPLGFELPSHKLASHLSKFDPQLFECESQLLKLEVSCHVLESHFPKLGNSGSVFPNCKPLFVKKDEFSIQVAELIKEDLKQLINAVKKGNYEEDCVNFIENSKLVEDAYIRYVTNLCNENEKILDKPHEISRPRLA